MLATVNPRMDLESAYRLMGLNRGASPQAVATAYRQLVRQLHPDRAGRDEAERARLEEAVKQLNDARDTITAHAGASPSGSVEQEPAHRTSSPYSVPRPSKTYTVEDLETLANMVMARGQTQSKVRAEVAGVPVDAGLTKANGNYGRPFGSVVSSRRLPKSTDATLLLDNLLRIRPLDQVFDIGITDQESWITWQYYPPYAEPGSILRRYTSVSFEVPKKRPKKKPGVGMKPEEARSLLRGLGLAQIAGGTKYRYWGVAGQTEKTGRFIREAKRTMREVERVRWYKGIDDRPLGDEEYFGQLTPTKLQKMAKFVRGRASNPDTTNRLRAKIQAIKRELLK